ncbi:hypothetical protein HPP92_006484 [Vanilla planifolia]|uniref:Uncharacterized protein n=1 Tax=Vanilla planifolia TaxID=51239 RepID=A0A835RJ55_VANPL|nr:hypothetical protein HPP92_006484 [Vanilla planifolia]
MHGLFCLKSLKRALRGSSRTPSSLLIIRPCLSLDEYQKLVFNAFEVEADIASMKDALEITIGEKEEAFVKHEILETKLDVISSKLNIALVDAELLKEELVRMDIKTNRWFKYNGKEA